MYSAIHFAVLNEHLLCGWYCDTWVKQSLPFRSFHWDFHCHWDTTCLLAIFLSVFLLCFGNLIPLKTNSSISTTTCKNFHYTFLLLTVTEAWPCPKDTGSLAALLRESCSSSHEFYFPAKKGALRVSSLPASPASSTWLLFYLCQSPPHTKWFIALYFFWLSLTLAHSGWRLPHLPYTLTPTIILRQIAEPNPSHTLTFP